MEKRPQFLPPIILCTIERDSFDRITGTPFLSFLKGFQLRFLWGQGRSQTSLNEEGWPGLRVAALYHVYYRPLYKVSFHEGLGAGLLTGGSSPPPVPFWLRPCCEGHCTADGNLFALVSLFSNQFRFSLNKLKVIILLSLTTDSASTDSSPVYTDTLYKQDKRILEFVLLQEKSIAL